MGLDLADDLLKAKDNSMHSGAAFLDPSKAFDIVHHERLIKCTKLELKTGPELVTRFRDYLHHRSQIVRSGNALSEAVFCGRGVPQGSKQ